MRQKALTPVFFFLLLIVNSASHALATVKISSNFLFYPPNLMLMPTNKMEPALALLFDDRSVIKTQYIEGHELYNDSDSEDELAIIGGVSENKKKKVNKQIAYPPEASIFYDNNEAYLNKILKDYRLEKTKGNKAKLDKIIVIDYHEESKKIASIFIPIEQSYTVPKVIAWLPGKVVLNEEDKNVIGIITSLHKEEEAILKSDKLPRSFLSKLLYVNLKKISVDSFVEDYNSYSYNFLPVYKVAKGTPLVLNCYDGEPPDRKVTLAFVKPKHHLELIKALKGQTVSIQYVVAKVDMSESLVARQIDVIKPRKACKKHFKSLLKIK